jgi:hypothetical protein
MIDIGMGDAVPRKKGGGGGAAFPLENIIGHHHARDCASSMKNYASSYNAQMSQYGQALRAAVCKYQIFVCNKRC